MRKNFLYYYKTYDNDYDSELEKINREAFNEYGYNFDSNRRKTILDSKMARTIHKRVINSKKNKNN